MLKTKSRKERPALVVTLPQELDPFKNLKFGIYDEEDAWEDLSPHGAKLI